MNENYGKLYIVSTPIGNMHDFSERAIEVLNDIDIVACEDTRETRKILSYYNIKKTLISYHKFNEQKKTDEIIALLKQGKDVALLSDQGTPIVSDPGYYLVKQVKKEKIFITAIPGACALINALVLSGIDSREFVFCGFLPTKQNDIKNKLESLKNEPRTLIFYVSVHKLVNNLKMMIEYFGKDRLASLIREMTKIYEEVFDGTLLEIYDEFSKRNNKGEYVIIISGKNENNLNNEVINCFDDVDVKVLYNNLLNDGLDEKDILKQIAKIKGVSKKEIYKMIKTK